MVKLLTFSFLIALLIVCNKANAQKIDVKTYIPERAYQYIPMIKVSLDKIWPDMPEPAFFPALVEQESCITLKHSRCWSPTAELKTEREYGFGFGQTTVAYNKDGSERFNVFKEIKQAHPSLRGWSWDDRYNPQMQLQALVVKNFVNWKTLTFPIASMEDKLAFLAVTYNGGSTFKDRILCKNQTGCDASKWWGNVELYSVKSKTPQKAYGGQSFFQISRKYPVNVLRIRMPKYKQYWKGIA